MSARQPDSCVHNKQHKQTNKQPARLTIPLVFEDLVGGFPPGLLLLQQRQQPLLLLTRAIHEVVPRLQQSLVWLVMLERCQTGPQLPDSSVRWVPIFSSIPLCSFHWCGLQWRWMGWRGYCKPPDHLWSTRPSQGDCQDSVLTTKQNKQKKTHSKRWREQCNMLKTPSRRHEDMHHILIL